MKKKSEYEGTVLEVIILNNSDIITTSREEFDNSNTDDYGWTTRPKDSWS